MYIHNNDVRGDMYRNRITLCVPKELMHQPVRIEQDWRQADNRIASNYNTRYNAPIVLVSHLVAIQDSNRLRSVCKKNKSASIVCN